MEIYQEIGYDLLVPIDRASIVTSFPKVTVVEGPNGTCITRNLSCHLAATEDIAQSLLLQVFFLLVINLDSMRFITQKGQANRKIAETPMNLRSSRSHAVFTIQLTSKKHDSDVIVKFGFDFFRPFPYHN